MRCTPIVPACGRLRQEDLEFQTNLSYIAKFYLKKTKMLNIQSALNKQGFGSTWGSWAPNSSGVDGERERERERENSGPWFSLFPSFGSDSLHAVGKGGGGS
jgi:hypothetical protein